MFNSLIFSQHERRTSAGRSVQQMVSSRTSRHVICSFVFYMLQLHRCKTSQCLHQQHLHHNLFMVACQGVDLSFIFTVRNSSCRKVMFSHASVILSRGACMIGGVHGKPRGHAMRGGQACVWQERLPFQRAARIQLECILVFWIFLLIL